MQQLVFPEHFVFHGPNTVDSFRDFCMDTVLCEVNQYSPEVFQLLKALGGVDEDDTSTRQSRSSVFGMNSCFTLLRVILWLASRHTSN
jgi:hypothetical protein